MGGRGGTDIFSLTPLQGGGHNKPPKPFTPLNPPPQGSGVRVSTQDIGVQGHFGCVCVGGVTQPTRSLLMSLCYTCPPPGTPGLINSPPRCIFLPQNHGLWLQKGSPWDGGRSVIPQLQAPRGSPRPVPAPGDRAECPQAPPCPTWGGSLPWAPPEGPARPVPFPPSAVSGHFPLSISFPSQRPLNPHTPPGPPTPT